MPREIVVRKPMTTLILIAVTVTIAAITIGTQGRSYSALDPIPFDDLRYLARRLPQHPMSTHMLAVIVMPIIGNILLFVPWGFLTFILFYTIDRATLQTYVLTTLLGLSLTLGIEAYQYFLPSRVADINDVIWNTAGTILGAILGHARLRVRFEFE
jgi:glycopeptide antibiotics resistance protein